jgi:hypothetical protein
LTPTYIPTYIHTYIHTHTYMHTYIYAYMHTYIHIYIGILLNAMLVLLPEATIPASHSTELLRARYSMKQQKKPSDNGKTNGGSVLRQP